MGETLIKFSYLILSYVPTYGTAEENKINRADYIDFPVGSISLWSADPGTNHSSNRRLMGSLVHLGQPGLDAGHTPRDCSQKVPVFYQLFL